MANRSLADVGFRQRSNVPLDRAVRLDPVTGDDRRPLRTVAAEAIH